MNKTQFLPLGCTLLKGYGERERRVSGVSRVQTDKCYDFEKRKIGDGGIIKDRETLPGEAQRRLQRESDVSKTSAEE